MKNVMMLADEMLEQVWGGSDVPYIDYDEINTNVIIADFGKNEKGHNEDIFRH